MHIDPWMSIAGLLVGFTVGLTGMGGGALMTPILVLLFKVQPFAAVSSDLVASVVMKPIGGFVHAKRGTVNRSLVAWLAKGSIPSAFAGVFLIRRIGHGALFEDRLKLLLGIVLLIASAAIVARAALQAKRSKAYQPPTIGPVAVKRVRTLAIGVLGGLVVGMTSVGSGSLIIVLLMMLYPLMPTSELVGTDLVQAIPLVASAAAGHLLFGDLKLAITASLLIGCIPGVYIGARLSSRATSSVIRPALVFILLASGLKLVNVGTAQLGIILLALAVIAIPVLYVLPARRRARRGRRAAHALS